MTNEILKLLSFRLYGRFAHFRKFYTNSSSLSYLIPPRTVIIGILGSILEYSRDSYYDDFSPESFRISVSIKPDTVIRKQIESVNYLQRSICKLELLMTRNGFIAYNIYLGCTDDSSLKKINLIESKIKERDFGYGVYLGQRQFRADIDSLKVYSDISFLETSEYTDTLCLIENAELEPDKNINNHIIIDQMPIHMKKDKEGRIPQIIKRVLYEKSGKRIYGTFKNCYQIGEQVISFYEG